MTKTSVEETGKLADLFSVDLALKVRRRLRAFETAERGIEMCAKEYDKDHDEPGELLFSIRALLDICRDISPTAGKIYDEFYKAVLSFVHADIRHLEEAFGMSAAELIRFLEAANVEARPVWKPMHTQPLYQGCERIGGSVAEHLNRRGICLPSSSSLSLEDQDFVIERIRDAHARSSAGLKT